MVDLKNISTQDLFQELANRKDGRTYIECVIAGLKMQECAKNAQSKAGQKILDYLQKYFEQLKRYYQERFDDSWLDNMVKDNVESNVVEEKDFQKLIYDYMQLTI